MNARRTLLVVATTLTGLSAGFFYTYEISATRALAQVDDLAYVTTFQAVQAVNETIRNPWFGIVFFGSIPAVAAAVAASWTAQPILRALTVTALGLYLAVVATTATGNVPLNEDLTDQR